MRGESSKQMSMLVLRSPEDLVPQDHPLRGVKTLADAALKEMSAEFDAMYASGGRSSIPPETLLKGSLLIALYSVRSERMLCEQLGYNMLFRWFLDMDMTETPFDHSTFSKNRERIMEHDVAREFFRHVVEQARHARLMSSEHFTVDGTLIEAWASLKSFLPRDSGRKGRKSAQKDGGDNDDGASGGSNPNVNFRGEKRSNETHESTTDPEAKLFRKGNSQAAKLYFSAHALMENRSGLLVDFRVEEANGYAERDTALAMLADNTRRSGGVTVGADKAYDQAVFVDVCRSLGVTPHVACNINSRRDSAIDQRTVRHGGYAISQRVRKRVEEIFGWMKTVGGFRKTRFKGRRRTELAAHLVGAAYNLIRMTRLLALA